MGLRHVIALPFATWHHQVREYNRAAEFCHKHVGNMLVPKAMINVSSVLVSGASNASPSTHPLQMLVWRLVHVGGPSAGLNLHDTASPFAYKRPSTPNHISSTIMPKLRLLNRLLQGYLHDTASPFAHKVHAPPQHSAPPCSISQRYLLRLVCCLL
jgi:hypothetical protein